MEYLLVILIGIGIFWLIFYYSNKAEQKKKEELKKELEKKESSSLKVSIPGVEKNKVEKAKFVRRTQESLDSLYASSHGMWVCHCCETLNDGGAIQCSACGAKK